MNTFGGGFFSGVVIGMIVTLLFVTYFSVPNVVLIKSGCAYYHPTTGNLTWRIGNDANNTIRQ